VTSDVRSETLEHSEERIFRPGRANPVVLRRNANALFLLQQIRDEAHRFAITYHRELRAKRRLRSVLDNIEGVGPVKRRAMLSAFGSVKRLSLASVDEIAVVDGIGPVLAAKVHAALAESRPDLAPGESEPGQSSDPPAGGSEGERSNGPAPAETGAKQSNDLPAESQTEQWSDPPPAGTEREHSSDLPPESQTEQSSDPSAAGTEGEHSSDLPPESQAEQSSDPPPAGTQTERSDDPA